MRITNLKKIWLIVSFVFILTPFVPADDFIHDPDFLENVDVLYAMDILVEFRIELFVHDVANHNYHRIIHYFASWYVDDQIWLEDEPEHIYQDALKAANLVMVRSAAIYADYDNQISSLADIRSFRVTEIWPDEIMFEAILTDEREVTFSLCIDREDLCFFGPVG